MADALHAQRASITQQDPRTAYNAACSAALAGRTDQAFELLHTAIALGWSNVQHLGKDSDLSSLRGDQRWAGVLAKAASAAKAQRVRWSSGAFATPFRDDLPVAEKAAGLAKLWSEAKYNFVHFAQVPDLDWDAAYMEALPRALATESTFAYYQELRRLVAKLEDGHSNVYLPSSLASMKCEPGLETRQIEGRVMIVRVDDRSAKQAGLHIGMEVLKVDGVAVKGYAEANVAPFLCASTQQDRLRRLYGRDLLRGPQREPIALTVRGADDAVREIEVARQSKMVARLRRFSQPAVRFEVLDGNIGYLQLNTFGSQSVLKQFVAKLAKIRATKALIIDLRKNGGGNSRIGWDILTHLTRQPVPTTRWHTLQYRPTARAWGRQPTTRHGGGPDRYSKTHEAIYDHPVALLIGPATFSAAEDMAAAFDQLDRGKLIGGATGGSTGQPLMFDLPGGGKARVCTKHDSYADGTEFVGVGIIPDVAVQQAVADLRAGIDTVLQAALRVLAPDPGAKK